MDDIDRLVTFFAGGQPAPKQTTIRNGGLWAGPDGQARLKSLVRKGLLQAYTVTEKERSLRKLLGDDAWLKVAPLVAFKMRQQQRR